MADSFFQDFMAMKAEWDQGCKERGTDLASLETSAKSDPKPMAVRKTKPSNFAPPSGTARLTEKNLKKMEVQNSKQESQSKFSKDKRFKDPETDDRQLLYPKIDYARQSYHASKTAIKPKVKRDPKHTVETETQTASTAATSVAGDRKAQAGSPLKKGVVIAKISALNDEELERLLRQQFRKNVGKLTQDVVVRDTKYSVIEKNVHGPVMTAKKTESRLKIEEEWQKHRGPSVGSYQPKSEAVLPNKTEARFTSQERFDLEPRGDFRRPLDPNLDAIRKVPQAAQILPEHEITRSEMIKEYYETKGGPTTYTPSYKLTEPRADVGIKKFMDNYVEPIPEEDTQRPLNPNYNFTKPNKLVFKYYQPTEQRPPHMPNSEAEPGRWVFYDVDLDAVRAELATNVYMGAKDETREEFAEREEFQRLLEEHIKRKQERRPEHGDYAKPYSENKIEGAAVDFSKQLGRQEQRELSDDEEMEGDVLILDPEKLKKRLPDLKFDKMVGRADNIIDEDEEREGDVLDLEPAKLEKKVAIIDFEKQLGRPERIDLDDEDIFVRDLPEDPVPKDPSAPKVIGHNFGLGADRFTHEQDRIRDELELVDDEVFIDPQPLEKKVKGFVAMDRGEERFRERLNPDPFYDDQPLNELDNDVHGALQKAIKPEISVPDFKRFTTGGKDKKIKDVIQEDDAKAKRKTANQAKAKTAYQVGKHFQDKAALVKKKKQMAAKKPKKAMQAAQDEVDQYLAEFGLL